VDVRLLLERLSPTDYPAADYARALVALADVLARSSAIAVQSSPDRARAVAEALLARDGGPAFGPLTRDLSKVEPGLRQQAERAADTIARGVTGPFIALSSHPASDVRVLSIRFLATRSEARAETRILESLNDSSEDVQHAALSALARSKSPAAVRAVAELLEKSPLWPVRVGAAETLASLTETARDARAFAVLSQAAQNDAYALVREAAVRALGRVAKLRSRPILTRIASSDSEPRVQQAAQVILNGQ
jgi:HEAT repeat protein